MSCSRPTKRLSVFWRRQSFAQLWTEVHFPEERPTDDAGRSLDAPSRPLAQAHSRPSSQRSQIPLGQRYRQEQGKTNHDPKQDHRLRIGPLRRRLSRRGNLPSHSVLPFLSLKAATWRRRTARWRSHERAARPRGAPKPQPPSRETGWKPLSQSRNATTSILKTAAARKKAESTSELLWRPSPSLLSMPQSS
jgi:hypothetical protein